MTLFLPLPIRRVCFLCIAMTILAISSALTAQESSQSTLPEISEGNSQTDLSQTDSAETDGVGTNDELNSKPEKFELQFRFEATPWRVVMTWLADSSDLALHVGDVPTGSFTYHDPGTFTPQEAIDRVNLFLLPQGYTLIRSGSLLSLIDLTDQRSEQQLDALARLVTLDELNELPAHEVAKSIFPLGELEAADAVEELSALNLMVVPKIFPKTNQLLMIDTAGKLRSAKKVLDAFEPKTLDNGTVVKNFSLEHVNAEDILVVARPHLGLAAGEMIGIDVSISADLKGKHLFVTGLEDKVKLIEGLVESIDVPSSSLSAKDGNLVLQTHEVTYGDPETVYNVLQTLLAGEEIRLSSDEETGNIVALAPPEIQKEIAATVEQLQGRGAEFETIQLKSVDPYFAISLLEQMLDLADPLALEEEDEEDPELPRVDADPGNMRLFVRAKKHEIEQIKKIIEGIDIGTESLPGMSGEEIRLFPMRGPQAEQLLRSAVKFWREENPVFFFPEAEKNESRMAERIVASTEGDTPPHPLRAVELHSPSAVLLTKNLASQQPAIRCQLSPRGLILQCEELDALDKFESLLRTISGPGELMAAEPVAFYLKYTKVEDAIRMLAELIDGGEAAREGEAGTLINGYVSSSDSILGSLVTSSDGTITMISGSVTIVGDSRLNRLIAQGSEKEIEEIENYLRIIDKDTSITSIETYGTSHVIELTYSKAEEVAAALRDAYGSRVAGGASKTSAASGGKAPPGSPQEQAQREAAAKEAAKNQPKKGAPQKQSAPPKSLEPKMTIAVHQPSNSLIVTAPPQLFKEVEQLAKLIDLRSQESVEVIRLPDGIPFSSLQQILSQGARVRSSSTGSPKSKK